MREPPPAPPVWHNALPELGALSEGLLRDGIVDAGEMVQSPEKFHLLKRSNQANTPQPMTITAAAPLLLCLRHRARATFSFFSHAVWRTIEESHNSFPCVQQGVANALF